MKKVLALALVFGLLFTLSACVGAPDGEPTVTTTTTTTTAAPTTTTTAEETLNTSVITDPAGITTTVPTTQFTKQTVIITTTTRTQASATVSRNEALALALEHAKLTEADVHDIDVEYDQRNDVAVWEVEFEYRNFEYTYVINAVSRAITSYVKNDPIHSTGIGGASETAPKYGITNEIALANALAHAEVDKQQATDVEVELDTEDGVYDITFEAGGYEYEYEVDAKTGMVVRHEKELGDCVNE